MKIKEGFMLKEVAGTSVVVPVGKASVDFNAMITLNESGAFLWKMLCDDVTEQQLIDALMGEYDVSADTASKDIEKFLENIRTAGLLEI